eukprot:c17631_g1_i1.p1 GENE.c17631_g1_i1~~c17631_g1_i1.p1  ORF type:complete len:656 (-),score=176.68 c17631_g1_i1:166-2133(-)
MTTIDVSSDSGLSALNEYLSSRSYIAGHSGTSADAAAFDLLAKDPGNAFPHVSRYFRQLQSFTPSELTKLRGVAPTGTFPTITSSGAAASSGSYSTSTGITTPASVALVDPYSKRVFIRRILEKNDGLDFVGQTLTVGGWVKSGRDQKQFAFIALNDGSTPLNLQVVVLPEIGTPFGKLVPTGTSLLVEGEIKPTPDDVKNAKQKVELHVTKIHYLGESDAGANPIAKTKLSLEFLRSVTHLRPRTNAISSVSRIRNSLAYATHLFFQTSGFLYIHAPIITGSDCEGAGEMFGVTTILTTAERNLKKGGSAPSEKEVADASKAVETHTKTVTDLKEKGDKVKKADKQSAEVSLNQAKKQLEELMYRKSLIGGVPHTGEGIDYTHDFFSKPSFLTVSGQLEAEVFACSMSSVYTFGPTFRAEDSHTTRHLAEFWMIEPEIAFCDIKGNMQCAEDYVRFCCKYVLEHCRADLEFMAERIDSTCLARVEQVANTPFKRLSYTEAITLLQEHIAQKKVTFTEDVHWGMDLGSEHERYICEKVFNMPTILYNYPKGIKAFYMRVNEDNKTVAAMDILVPGIGELIGGSQREERPDVLANRITEMGLPLEPYSWYLDLRRFGTVVHSGFGLGFERLIMFCTGMENIRDVIPFPRWPGHCEL